MADPRNVLVLDLDGTMYRGPGPVLLYARALADTLPADAGASMLSDIDAFLAGTGDPELAGSSDAWVAVRLAADRYRIAADAVQPAFLASRAGLADGSCAVEVPAGLIALLADLAGSTLRVLATNSPIDGLDAFVTRLGAADVVDRIVPSAGKPSGLQTLLPELAAPLGNPNRLLSLGDHWHNDLAPALAIGAVAFYVDTYDRNEGPAHARASRVEDLLDDLAAWAADPDDFVATHPLRDAIEEGAQPTWPPSSSGAVSASSGPARY